MDILHQPALAIANLVLLVKRIVDPAAASASLLAALPTSILSILATNQAAAVNAILSDIDGTSTAAWFLGLPTEVQQYFITSYSAAASSATAPGPGTTALRTTSTSTTSSSITSANNPGTPSTFTTSNSRTSSILSASSSTSLVGNDHTHKSLSTGAKAGIAVGVILGCALLAAIIFLFFVHQRKKTHNEDTQTREKAYIASDSAYAGDPISEMDGKPALQPIAHPNEPISELPGQSAYVPSSYSATSTIPIAARSPSVMEKEVVASPEKEVFAPAGSSIVSQASDQTLGGSRSVYSELDRLKEEQEKIAAKRQRLQALHELDEQEEVVNRRISALLSQPRN